MKFLAWILAAQCWLLSIGFAQLKWISTEEATTPAPENKTAEFTFTAKNEGRKPVSISAITPNCHCVTATASTKSVPVGGSVTVKAVMELGILQGEQRKEIIITSQAEGAAEPERETLGATAKLETYFQIEGTVAKFIQNKPGQTHQATIKVLSKNPIRLKLGKPSTSAVEVSMIEKVPGREYQVTLTGQDLSKKDLGFVTLTSDSPFPRAKQLDLFYTIVAARP